MNHKSRKESDEEEIDIERFVESLWMKYIWSSYFWSKQTEWARRKARTQFFEYCVFNKDTILLTGHHLDDRIETTLLNTERWAWLRGKINMRKESQKIIRKLSWETLQCVHLRPLLDIPKQDIYNQAEQSGIIYFEDETNKDPLYGKRNAMRKKLAEQWGVDYEFYRKQYENLENKMNSIKEDLKIEPLVPIWSWVTQYMKISSFTNIETLQDLLDYLWIYHNISQNFLEEMIDFFCKKSWYKYVRDWFFFRCHGTTYLIKSKSKFRQNELYIPIDYKWSGTIRPPKDGDRIWWKRVRKHLLNQKIPIFLRGNIQVIEENEVLRSSVSRKELLTAKYM